MMLHGSVVFDHLPTWWLVAESAVSERLAVCDLVFRWIPKLDARLDDSKRFPRRWQLANRKWLSGTVPGVSNGRNWLGRPRINAMHRHIGNRSGTHIRYVFATLECGRNLLGQSQTSARNDEIRFFGLFVFHNSTCKLTPTYVDIFGCEVSDVTMMKMCWERQKWI